MAAERYPRALTSSSCLAAWPPECGPFWSQDTRRPARPPGRHDDRLDVRPCPRGPGCPGQVRRRRHVADEVEERRYPPFAMASEPMSSTRPERGRESTVANPEDILGCKKSVTALPAHRPMFSPQRMTSTCRRDMLSVARRFARPPAAASTSAQPVPRWRCLGSGRRYSGRSGHARSRLRRETGMAATSARSGDRCREQLRPARCPPAP